MRPTTPTSAAEHKVLRWLLGALAIGAALLLGFTWHSRAGECAAACRAKGAAGGEVKVSGGGRLNLGPRCECVGQARPPAAR